MTDASQALAQGRRLLDAGFAGEALSLLERAHLEAPGNPDCSRWLAEALLLQNRREEGQTPLEASPAAAMWPPDLGVARSDIAFGDGDIERAKDILKIVPVADSA